MAVLRAEVAGQVVNGSGENSVSPWQAVFLTIANEFWPGILSAIAIGATAYLAIEGKQVPGILSDLDIAIIAFYFGARGRGPLTVGGKQ